MSDSIEKTIQAKLETMTGSDNDSLFLKRIFSRGIEIYQKRLEQYGLKGFDKVLDAGCGFGQWALALKKLNHQVDAFDVDMKRVNFLRTLIAEGDIKNLNVSQGGLGAINQRDETYDAVFCYGVIFVTPWKESLKELTRVLKKNGTLYVNANGFGWYKNLWYTEHNKTNDYDPKLVAAETFKNTYNYQSGLSVSFPTQILIEPAELKTELEKLGYGEIRWDGEGLLNNPSNNETFFRKSYMNDTGVYEFMAIKG